jgi:translocator protein
VSIVAVGAATLWEAALAVSNRHWYAGLLKPTFAPAPWLAGVASLMLAAILVLALFRVLGTPDYLPDRPLALRLFGLGLASDAVWSWLFFGGRHPSVALAAAAALAVAVALAAWRFASVDRRAGLMLLPWLLAAGFAFLLDLSIALRNG